VKAELLVRFSGCAGSLWSVQLSARLLCLNGCGSGRKTVAYFFDTKECELERLHQLRNARKIFSVAVILSSWRRVNVGLTSK